MSLALAKQHDAKLKLNQDNLAALGFLFGPLAA
jgi:hypothetical protein